MKKKIHTQLLPQGTDTLLFVFIITLVIFGLMVLASASSPIGYERFGDSYHFVKRQLLFGIVPGLIMTIALMRVSYMVWFQHYKLLLLIGIGLLFTVFIPQLKAGYGTSQSWITIGALSLQPAEFTKLFFILGVAGLFASRQQQKRHLGDDGFFSFILVLLVVAILLVLQPDVGTLVIVTAIGMSMYFIAGARPRNMCVVVGCGLATLFALIISAPYRLARFFTFLNPTADVQGAGYQLHQALIAVGSGGWFGLGLGHSRQKFLYLPEVTSDSIFAILSEELGFVVATIFLIILMVLCVRMLKMARLMHEEYGRLVVTGMVSWIFVQSVVNVSAIVGLLPLTGVPLPFVSHGGSSMLSMLAGLGIVLNISSKRRI